MLGRGLGGVRPSALQRRMRVTPALTLVLVCLFVAACADTTPAPIVPTVASVEAAAGAAPSPTVIAPPSGPRHAFTVDDMLSFDRISDAAVSPDGKLVEFTVVDARPRGEQADEGRLARRDRRLGRPAPDEPPARPTSARASPPTERASYFLSSRSGSIAGVAHRGRRRRGHAGDAPSGRRRRRPAVPRRKAAPARARRRTPSARRSTRARSARRRTRARSRTCERTTSSPSATGTRGTTGGGRTSSCFATGAASRSIS